MNQIFKQGYALLIGVGNDLPVTVKDAEALHDILIDSQRCAYPTHQVKLLTEKQATRQGITDGLDWLIAQVKDVPDAMVIVYYSGHGWYMPHYHLVPYDYNQNDIAHTAVSSTEITKKLRTIQTQKLLVLLDCCHAGGMAEANMTKAPLPPESDLNTMLSKGSGRVIIASSRKDEISEVGNPYSQFTQALLEGLAGYGAAEDNGYAYLTDVALYIGRMVPNRTFNQQHPILKLSATDNFALAYYAGGDKKPKPLPNTQNRSILNKDIQLDESYLRILKQYRQNLLQVEERMAQFIDQATIPLDLERTKTGILQKIDEIEQASFGTKKTLSSFKQTKVSLILLIGLSILLIAFLSVFKHNARQNEETVAETQKAETLKIEQTVNNDGIAVINTNSGNVTITNTTSQDDKKSTENP